MKLSKDLLVICLGAALAVGCSKDDDDKNADPSSKKPKSEQQKKETSKKPTAEEAIKKAADKTAPKTGGDAGKTGTTGDDDAEVVSNEVQGIMSSLLSELQAELGNATQADQTFTALMAAEAQSDFAGLSANDVGQYITENFADESQSTRQALADFYGSLKQIEDQEFVKAYISAYLDAKAGN